MDSEERARRYTAKRFLRKFKEVLKGTRLTTSELSSLMNLYISFSDRITGLACVMSQARFLHVMDSFYEITDSEVIAEYVKQFEAVLPKDRHITIMFWIALNNFMFRSTLDEKIDFCFKYYDKFNYGFITRDLAIEYISKTILDVREEDLAQDMADFLVEYFDSKGCGVITQEEFRNLVHHKPDLLQCFGRFLPGPHIIRFAEVLIFHNISQF